MKKMNYFYNGKPKEIREYSPKDTSSYQCILYYSNGKKEMEGEVIHSKKEGEWQEWYADGALRRTIEYVNGELNPLCSA